MVTKFITVSSLGTVHTKSVEQINVLKLCHNHHKLNVIKNSMLLDVSVCGNRGIKISAQGLFAIAFPL